MGIFTVRALNCGALTSVLTVAAVVASAADSWPPELKGAVRGTVTFSSPDLVNIPEDVRKQASDPKAAPFEVATKAPTIDLAFHGQLGPDAASRRLWSSWGDICVASDGRVYCAIGDHGDDVGGDARCFLYRWDPARKELEQVVDMNQVVPPRKGRPAWSKVHAKIDEGRDGKIYFSCTLNDGNRARLSTYGWDDQLPGGQLYQFDPQTGKTVVFANLPPRRCTATSRLDRQRNIWWCNLEAGEGNALWGLDLTSRQPVVQTPDETVAFNRAFALARDGSIFFNGDDHLLKLDGKSHRISDCRAAFVESPGVRCASEETSDGYIYGVTHGTAQLFRYSVPRDELRFLGPVFLTGGYTTVIELSPDERYLYYLPGAHGRAQQVGTPVVRYERATGKRVVVAFLADYCQHTFGYVPGGTYGMKLSADGRTIYVNFNGHAVEELRPKHLKTDGFGLTSFAAIHLPEE